MKGKISTLIGAILMICVVALAANTFGQKPDDSHTATANDAAVTKANADDETAAREQWEYLVVAGGNTNLSPSGSSSMRKEPKQQAFRENFVLAQNMDKLGAQGWELTSVSGSPGDPVYYFKRRK